MSQKSGAKAQKMTAKQKEARIRAAQEREQRAKAAKERSSRIKRIVTIIVCVILVLAMFIPTMALSVLSGS